MATRRWFAGPASVVRGSLNAAVDPAWLKQELLAALRPILVLSPSSYRDWHQATGGIGAGENIGDRLSHVADAQVALADGNQVTSMISAINARPGADAFWAELVDELTSLLRQSLDLH